MLGQPTLVDKPLLLQLGLGVSEHVIPNFHPDLLIVPFHF